MEILLTSTASATLAFVAVAALPVQDPDEPDVLPVTLPVKGPVKPSATKVPVTVPPVLEVSNFFELSW